MSVATTLLVVACSGGDKPGVGPGADGGPGGGGSGEGGTDASGGGGGSDGPVCTVKTPGTAGVVLEGTVLAPDTILRGGQVLVDAQGKITCVAQSCATAPGFAAATFLDCKNGVISPGLINPHDHITFANNAPKGHGQERYDHRHDWRIGKNGHAKITTASNAPADVVRFAELRFVMSGATSIAGAGGQRGLARNVDVAPANLEGIDMKVANSDTFPLGDQSGTTRTDCNYASGRTTTAEITKYDGYLPHLAEGINPEARNEVTCSATGAFDLIQKQTAIIHSIGVKPADAALYRTDMTAVIWSPRSNVDLYGDTAPVVMLDNQGVQIALGTDWMPSGSMNLSRELRCADELNAKHYGKHFTDEQLWRMVTTNAAFAVGGQRVIGMLKPGYAADIAVFDGRIRKDHRAVVGAGVEDVALVLRGGAALYGDADVVGDATLGGPSCETLDVCGVAKRACVEKDLGAGTTLARVRAAGEAIYPLFFCRDATPKDEPSCVPFRTSYSGGITATDKDGDGIADADDNCPDVFNPKRPVDGATQGDADGDGKGDACDACPEAAGETCTKPSANDVDGDGVANGTDNCPELANADQADADKDGFGDACPPPAAVPAVTLTIPALRNPTSTTRPAIDAGVRVKVDGVVVTHVKTAGNSKGFVVQDTAATSWAGVYVFVGGTAPTVVVGDLVTVTGVYSSFRGLEQLNTTTGGSFAKTGTGTVPTPMVVTIPDVNSVDLGAAPGRSLELQSMLVRLNTVTALTATVGTDFTIAPQGATTPVAIVTSFLANDTAASPFPATAAANYASITGIVDAFATAAPFKARVAPRSALDVAAQ